MLKTMRSNLKSLSWALWLVILAFVGFIFIEWGSGRFDPSGDDSNLLTIGGQAIPAEKYQYQLSRAIDMYRQRFKESFNKSFIQQLNIPQQVMQSMVNSAVIRNEAAKLNLEVTDKEIGQAIVKYPAFQRDGKFVGQKEYENLLAYSQVRVQDFENDLRNDLLVDKLKSLVSSGLVPDPADLPEKYRQENDKVDAEYIRFDPDRIHETIVPSEGELQAYFQKNKDRFKSPEKRSGLAVTLKYSDFKAAATVSNEELFTYYQENKRSFVLPGKTRVSRILLKYDEKNREDILKQGDALSRELNDKIFAAKAREISQDDKAKDGGDWGYWGWKEFTSQEQRIVEGLAEKEVSTPVDTGKEFSILMASEKVSDRQETFDETKARIRADLEGRKMRERTRKQMDKYYEKIQGSKGLRQATEDLHLKVVEIPEVTNGQTVPGKDPEGYFSRKFFELKTGEISSPLELPEGFGVVQLIRIVPPQAQTLEQARGKISEQVVTAKKVDMLVAQAESILNQLRSLSDPKKIEELLKKENLTLETTEYRRGNRLADLPRLNGLDDTIFAMSEGTFSSPIRFQTAVMLIKPKSKKVTTPADFEREKAKFYEQKKSELQDSFFSAYVWSKRENYPVKVNSQLLAKINDYVISRF